MPGMWAGRCSKIYYDDAVDIGVLGNAKTKSVLPMSTRKIQGDSLVGYCPIRHEVWMQYTYQPF
eukprot:scaffold200_cov173-Amphora_coffeaeformis.AAC.8